MNTKYFHRSVIVNHFDIEEADLFFVNFEKENIV